MLRRSWLQVSALASAVVALPARAKTAMTTHHSDVTVGPEGYKRIVRSIRDTFPSPTNSAAADSRFSRVMAYALSEYEKLKTHRTFLGERKPLDYAGARKSRVNKEMGDMRGTIRETARNL